MKQLYKLKVAEMSLVPRGANKKKILVLKEHNGESPMAKMDKATLQKIAKGDAKVMTKFESVIKAFDEKMAAEGEQGLSDKAKTAAKAIVRIASAFKDEPGMGEILEGALSAAGMAPANNDAADDEENPADPAGENVEMNADDPAGEDADDEESDEEGDDADSAHEAGMAAYMGAVKDHKKVKKVAKNKDGKQAEGESNSMGKITKEDGTLDLSSLDPEVAEAVQAIYKGQTDAIKKAADLEKDLKVEREIRITKEFKEKAAGYSHLGLEQEKLAKIMKSASERSAEELTELESVLKAANEQAKNGALFKEFGSSLPATGNVSWDQIEKSAEGYVAKSGEKITKEQAVDKFLQTTEGKQMYAAHQAGKKGGI